MRYDPETPPDAADWLALDEMARVQLVKKHHQAQRLRMPNLSVHAMFHTIVENQLAEGYAPAVRAMARLMAGGLSRHDAVHAIGSVIVGFVYEAAKSPDASPAGDLQPAIAVAMDRLTAASWRQSGGDDEPA